MFVSLGGNCSVAYQLKKLKLRELALPFDWADSKIEHIISVLKDNFAEYLRIKKIKYSESHESYLLTNSYNIKLAHQIDKETITRRITRFMKVCQCNSIHFIRIEHKKINLEKYKKYLEELKNILGKYCKDFKLTVILSDKYTDMIKDVDITFYYYSGFIDWQYNNFDWKIFSIIL